MNRNYAVLSLLINKVGMKTTNDEKKVEKYLVILNNITVLSYIRQKGVSNLFKTIQLLIIIKY